jgi:hypothetical protein
MLLIHEDLSSVSEMRAMGRMGGTAPARAPHGSALALGALEVLRGRYLWCEDSATAASLRCCPNFKENTV